MMTDPLGDMIARIKNAAMRSRSKVSTPASALRRRVLDVLQTEGYIRGYALVEVPGQFPTFEIEIDDAEWAAIQDEFARPAEREAAREVAISYAAYRLPGGPVASLVSLRPKKSFGWFSPPEGPRCPGPGRHQNPTPVSPTST